MRYFKFLLTGIIICLLSCASSSQQAKSNSENNLPANCDPVQIKFIEPRYPAYEYYNGITGWVWVKVLIDTNGNVKKAIALNGQNVEDFEYNAVKAAMKTKWRPARENGEPIETWTTIKINFNIF